MTLNTLNSTRTMFYLYIPLKHSETWTPFFDGQMAENENKAK